MNLIQFLDSNGQRAVGVVEGASARRLNDATSVYDLAISAFQTDTGLGALVKKMGLGDTIDRDLILAEGRMLAPIDHPDPAHLYLTGTGLTHLGSASTRDAMHTANTGSSEAGLTDTMKMFRMGLENGKPADGEKGVQPEWFYKGNGYSIIAPGHPIPSPAFALDAGEEPEIAGIYVIDQHGQPRRLGFAIANEFSDHVTERVNYLYLAHSKLRACSFGPEMRVGDLPAHIEGTSKIVRNGETIWEKPFLSGEDNMSHTIANLEYHHFKYDLFRTPGDVHVHMFGTATLSFADGISTKPGDVFEIEESQFGAALRNPIRIDQETPVTVGNIY
ncbi:GguC family protein [Devosia rhodophyticola]|uniref:GguC family protein n=1 Tax=Devosia rhodophyticola TaxID=3026423 RepID=A0ABY7YW71_9HYPH|nr:AraD1 family protein [Devosia rhodophyticola]WDR05437.1 GguC family protein [Devosia rhodophyticola]